jgi:hypothetical protein
MMDFFFNEFSMTAGSPTTMKMAFPLTLSLSPKMGGGVKNLEYTPSPYPLPPGERVKILK